jgi:hypothetical protein
VRSDAKASSARPTMRGSGRLGVLSFTVALFASLLFATSVFASKEVVDYIGGDTSNGSKGGEFWNPGNIAVNSTGAGPANPGDIYVVDQTNNRIQRFDEDGNFISAWGANVLTASSDEVQTIDVSATAGTYTLSFEGATTTALPYNATASELQTALLALPTSGDPNRTNVFVNGEGSFTVRFSNGLAATNVAQISADTSLLTGTVSTATTTQGSGQYEICTVAGDCRGGAASGAANTTGNAKNGSLDDPQSVAVDGDTGNVYVSDRRDNRVNEYTGDGTFIRSFGFGVDATTAGVGYEVCPAADRCTSGLPGAGAGQIGDTGLFGSGRLGIAISPPDGNAATGTLFLADTPNRRVNTYELDGTNPSSFGSEAQFGESQPRKVAVDSRGIVYASNSTGEGEIERYDTENANSGGVGFLAPIASPPLLEGSAESATIDLAVDPDSDGAGSDQDVLYVLRGTTSFTAVVQQFGPVNDPGLTAAPTAVDDTHGQGAEFRPFDTVGLGFDPLSGRLFVSSGFARGENAARVYILDNEPPAPAASIDAVTEFDAHSATFSGSVDPNGARTGYHFEYVNDAEFQANGFANAQRTPLADRNVGAGEDPVTVEDPIPSQLIPSTTYHVRLVVKQTFSATQISSSPVTFTTPGASPSLQAAATDVEVNGATLRGAINPEGQAVTNYHFEWGASNAYGNSTPPATLPTGSQPVAVDAELSGLTPGQPYHYRLVATNATGTTQGPDQTFTPQAPPQLPERGYEIASSYPTLGIPIIEFPGGQVPSEDGNSIAVSSINTLRHTTTIPRLPDQLGPQQYRFKRGTDGWQREDLGIASNSAGVGAWSADLERFLTTTSTDAAGTGFRWEDARVDPDDQNQSEDVYQRQPDGSLVWISRDPRIPVGTPQTAEGIADVASSVAAFAMSRDGHTVVFKSRRQLLDADTTPESGPAAPERLYKWQDGQLSFIGVRPDGSVPAAGSYLGIGEPLSDAARYQVSSDGSRVIWGAGGNALYVQTDGEPTVEATKEEGVPPLSSLLNVKYRGATEDGSRVFFTSASRLTPDSGAGAENGGAADLYVYDVETDTLRDLTPRLDGLEDPAVDPTPTDRADVLGVAANSANGKRVYFVANAQYPTAPNPEGNLPSPSGRNLYMAELEDIDGPIELSFIASLGSEDDGDWQVSWRASSGSNGYNSGKTALASEDGSVLGFGSTESLTGQPLGGTEQLFAYDAERGTLVCPSCPTDGSLPTQSVNEYESNPHQSRADWQGLMGVRRWVSNDGTVFFTSSTALLPADQNLVNDIYEYRDGTLGLVTSGTATTGAVLSNASRDGSTVFFNTQAALVPQDKEPGVSKIYAARVGGGFPYVAPQPPCDFNAGACEGATSAAPQVPGAGTAAFEGPGDPKSSSKRACPKAKRKVRVKGKTRCISKRHHKRNAKNDRRASR